MIDRLNAIETKYESLQQELMHEDTLKDINKTKEISKEMAELEDTVTCYRKYKKVLENIQDTKEMTKDPELGEMAKEELKDLEKEQTELESCRRR